MKDTNGREPSAAAVVQYARDTGLSTYEARKVLTETLSETKATVAALDAKKHLSNLLARIHRDGGHYEDEQGTEKAVADANKIVADLHGVLDEVRQITAQKICHCACCRGVREVLTR